MRETPPAADPAADYFSAIESEFIRRRGTPFLLSPSDFALMRRWHGLGIPLEDVLEGIHAAFDRRLERGAAGRVNSLRYCEGAVLEAWETRSRARVGKGGGGAGPGAADPREILGALAEEIGELALRKPEIAEAAERSRRAVERLADSGRAPEEIEDALGRAERKFFREAAEALPSGIRDSIEEEISARLAPAADRMSAAAEKRTREILRRQRLRRLWDAPRFTLLGR
jgi:hypothetical protein